MPLGCWKIPTVVSLFVTLSSFAAVSADLELLCSGSYSQPPDNGRRAQFKISIHYADRRVVLQAPPPAIPSYPMGVAHLNLVQMDATSFTFEAPEVAARNPQFKRIIGTLSRTDGGAAIGIADTEPMGLLGGDCEPQKPRF